jgi:hypothetical protein
MPGFEKLSAAQIAKIAPGIYKAYADGQDNEMKKYGFDSSANTARRGQDVQAGIHGYDVDVRAGTADKDRASRDKNFADGLSSQERRAATRVTRNGSGKGADDGGDLLSGIPERLWNKATEELRKRDEHINATNDAVANAEKMSKIGGISGHMPGIIGGQSEEYDSLKANVSAAVVGRVPGIRSDSDYKNIVVPMLPKPTDTEEVAAEKVATFKRWLEAQTPETPVLRNYGKDGATPKKESSGGSNSGKKSTMHGGDLP